MNAMEASSIPAKDIEENRQLAALSYLWVFSVIVLLARRESPFARWHARQAAVLFFISIAVWFLPLARYMELVLLAFMVVGFIEAAMGNIYRLPLIGLIAEGRLRWTDVQKGWHTVKHAAIRMVKPEHVTPYFREELQREAAAPLPAVPEDELLKREEKKLSSLLRRVEEDEKKLSRLEETVKTLQFPPSP